MTQNSKLKIQNFICNSPEETFALAEKIGESLKGGEIILLSGGLGAGKTLFTKGLMNALEYDIDDVTSPSFTLVNQYDSKFSVFHIDLWRLDEKLDLVKAVGLDEILEDEKAVVLIEWAERLRNFDLRRNVIKIEIQGDGDDPRRISVNGQI